MPASPKSRTPAPRRKRGLGPELFVLAGAGVLVLLMLGGLAFYWSTGGFDLLEVAALERQTLTEGTAWSLDLPVQSRGIPAGELQFSLLEGPIGLVIDERTGRLSWTPPEEAGPGEYPVRVRAAGHRRRAEARILLQVDEHNTPPVLDPVESISIEQGQPVRIHLAAHDPDLPQQKLAFDLLESASDEAAISTRSGDFVWRTKRAEPDNIYDFVVRVRDSLDAESEPVRFSITVTPRKPVADAPAPQPTETMPDEPLPVVDEPVTELPRVAAASDSPLVAGLRKLFDEHRLLARKPKDYAAVRRLFAEQFANEQAESMRLAFGDERDAIDKWLNQHGDFKEELYTALRSDWDDVPEALNLVANLWKNFPQAMEPYGELVIATATVWDRKTAGIIDSQEHIRRAQATAPPEPMGALANFRYLVDTEDLMEGRIRYLPWEFLVHVVNHTTPLADRQWALANYLNQRVGIGKCYHDCPYDMLMLKTDSRQARMNNQVYTLQNLRQLGGVCSLQADYAARVAKSLGVPAADVSGQGRTGQYHAWVMWVELASVTPQAIKFELKSHGRYRGDNYYIGTLTDPRTGEPITDRELEMQLHSAGTSPLAHRHADLLMRAYPMLVRRDPPLEPVQQLDYLEKVLEIDPWNEAAWLEAARLARSLRGEPQYSKAIRRVLDGLFTTFAAFPDFTWKVFEDLTSYAEDEKLRRNMYEQLLNMYVAAQRPDLAADAGLKLADLLAADNQQAAAVQGLSGIVLAFPTEGQFVPKLVDRIELLCDKLPDTGPKLARFYDALLPKVPRQRLDEPSEYCMALLRKAIACYERQGEAERAAAARAELQRLESAAAPN
ncbi:MAG: putative Ig domain-containing protein [Pirellulales bacterium]|nr:putative Ig domain-containing protein [Pirellulales bacterium]